MPRIEQTHYQITAEDIASVPFDTYFEPLIQNPTVLPGFDAPHVQEDVDDFFHPPGRSHYRLLAYLSTLFNDAVIVDVGTHRGQSAAALSYNTSNVVHTFDIYDKVYNERIHQRPNIQFHGSPENDNLFETAGQDRWADTIRQSAFIFLDVDPHNGTMELAFYEYLKRIDYQGFVVCDDVWYFKEMRDQFWYQIPDNERYDLSLLGHYSGTGVFTLNPKITFTKPDLRHWTLVTAYFNLTKCPDASAEICARNSDYYMSSSLSTLHLPYNLVVYCDDESLPLIQARRPAYLNDRTQYIVGAFDELRFMSAPDTTFATYREQIIENRRKRPYHFDPRNTASYYLFCLSRYMMLQHVIKTNPFHGTHFAWINFCIERMGYNNLKHLEEALSCNRDKFSTCYIDYIPPTLVNNTAEYFQFGRCSMCSGFFTGNGFYMNEVCELIIQKFLRYLGEGYGHADEQLYSPVFFDHPALFDHYYGDYHQMITNYKYIYDCPGAPIRNFIHNSYHHQEFALCARACKVVWESYHRGACQCSEDELKQLCYYFMMSASKCPVV